MLIQSLEMILLAILIYLLLLSEGAIINIVPSQERNPKELPTIYYVYIRDSCFDLGLDSGDHIAFAV